MEGYLRPGCVHVTVQAIVDSNTNEASVAGGISNVMRQLIARAGLSKSASPETRSVACLLVTCTMICTDRHLCVCSWH